MEYMMSKSLYTETHPLLCQTQNKNKVCLRKNVLYRDRAA